MRASPASGRRACDPRQGRARRSRSAGAPPGTRHGTGNEDVELALPQTHLCVNVGESEAPGRRERKVVIDPAPRAPCRTDSTIDFLSSARTSGRERTSRSYSGSSATSVDDPIRVTGTLRDPGRKDRCKRFLSSRAAPNSVTLTSAIPAMKSNAGSSEGAAPTIPRRARPALGGAPQTQAHAGRRPRSRTRQNGRGLGGRPARTRRRPHRRRPGPGARRRGRTPVGRT